ncbi:MFS transporter, partial [Burkholderia pseudomallei]|nr:MFS transporter [Burkholderia pseudomallei]
ILPLLAWIDASSSIAQLFAVQAMLSVTLASYYGPFGAMIAVIVPANMRSTGLSLAYNVAVRVFGGFGQFIVTWLIKTTGTPLAPTYYVMAGLALSLVALAFVPARSGDLD